MEVRVYEIMEDGVQVPFFGDGFVGTVRTVIWCIVQWWTNRG